MDGLFGLDILKLHEYSREIMAAIVAVATFALMFYRLGRKHGNSDDKSQLALLNEQNGELANKVLKFDNRFRVLEDIVTDPQDFWTRPPEPPFDPLVHQGQVSQSIPIVTVVNFKGGVGKTTICANLAGYFASIGKRVLLIDFDYQGSLTDTVLSHAGIDKFSFTSQQLIEGDKTPEVVRQAAERLSSLSSNIWMYPAFYGFSRSEIQMMFRWLVGKDGEIRYNLHNYLQSAPFLPSSESGFDIVLIDAPPRLLTGAVNALAASTHVIVPTILDGQSHVATLNTLGAIQQFRQKLNKRLKTVGVVPSLVSRQNGYNEREQRFIEELERQIPTFHLDGPLPILKDRPILRKEDLAKAGGQEVVYLSSKNDKDTNEIRAMFGSLGEYLAERFEWRTASTGQVIALPGQSGVAKYENPRTATSA